MAGIKMQCEQVNLMDHKTAGGANFYSVNPKGNVPTIVLDDGTVLNENVACLCWIADQAQGKVGPMPGTSDRYKMLNCLGFINSELHQSIGGLFNPSHNNETKAFYNKLNEKRLQYVEQTMIKDHQFCIGNSFTVCDAYLYIVLSWCSQVGINLSSYPNIRRYMDHIGNLAQVKAAKERMNSSPTTVC
jgi:glutathione S-transferase